MSEERSTSCAWALAVLAAVLGVGLVIGLIVSLSLFARSPMAAESQAATSARRVLVTVNTSGTAGSAGGTGYSDEMVRGEVLAVYLDYSATISATTDLTLRGKSAPYDTILSASNYYTDTWVYPRKAVQDYTNTDITYDGTHGVYEPFVMDDYLTAVITQSTAVSPCVKVYVYWR